MPIIKNEDSRNNFFIKIYHFQAKLKYIKANSRKEKVKFS